MQSEILNESESIAKGMEQATGNLLICSLSVVLQFEHRPVEILLYGLITCARISHDC